MCDRGGNFLRLPPSCVLCACLKNAKNYRFWYCGRALSETINLNDAVAWGYAILMNLHMVEIDVHSCHYKGRIWQWCLHKLLNILQSLKVLPLAEF